MKYYKITCGTPFVGEENDYYIATDDKKELDTFIDDCIYENGLEWCDDYELEMHDMTEEEYFAECGLVGLLEISKEEFLEACPWVKNERKEEE